MTLDACDFFFAPDRSPGSTIKQVRASLRFHAVREDVEMLAAGEMPDGEVVRSIAVLAASGAFWKHVAPDLLFVRAAGRDVQVPRFHPPRRQNCRPAVAEK